MDIASTLPMLKEMAADLRDGIKGLDPCPAGICRCYCRRKTKDNYNDDNT